MDRRTELGARVAAVAMMRAAAPIVPEAAAVLAPPKKATIDPLAAKVVHAKPKESGLGLVVEQEAVLEAMEKDQDRHPSLDQVALARRKPVHGAPVAHRLASLRLVRLLDIALAVPRPRCLLGARVLILA